jgi:hypothetical protein
MFKGDSADMCTRKFLLVSMGGQVEGLACADPGARTPIGASGNFNILRMVQWRGIGWPKCNCRYARVQAIGINLRLQSEKNHNFHKNASILINKVTFFSSDIRSHDITKLKVIQKQLGPFWATFWLYLPKFSLNLRSTESIGQLLAFINISHASFIICAFTYCKIYILSMFST